MAFQANRRIIVVGGSSRALTNPAEFQQACQALGRELVRAGFKVRAGSLSDSTADYWIAKAAYKEAPSAVEFYRPTNDETETDDRRKEFEGVSFIKSAERWPETYPLMIDGAHGLLIVGGASHTQMLWNAADRRTNFPRIAIPAFMGTAQKCFQRHQKEYQQLVHSADSWSDLTKWDSRASARVWISVLKQLVDAPQTPTTAREANNLSASSVVDLQGTAHGGAQASAAATSSAAPLPLPEAPTGIAVTLEDKPPPADLLDRQPLADALAAMFASRHQPTPLTVAILGDWGSGKTTLMEMTKEALREVDQEVKFFHAHYSAWHYEHVANTFAGLANEVVRGVSKGVEWYRWPLVVVRFAAAEHGWNLVWALVQFLAATAGAALAVRWAVEAAQAAANSESAVAKAILSVATGSGAIYFFLSLVQQLRSLFGTPFADRLATYFRLPEYGQHLGLVPVLQRQLRHLCHFALGTPARRLLVVIEDLDRCGAKCINETLDAVRLIVDLPGVIVVLLIDHRIAFKAVEQRFSPLADGLRSSQVIARDFLGKIVQLPIVLAPPMSLKRFIEQRLFAAPGDGHASRGAADPAPVADDAREPAAKSPSREGPPAQSAPPEAVDPPGSPRQPKARQAAVALEQAMHHTPEEAAEFERLATAFALTNPRRLTRLRNSYRLAKLLVYQRFQRRNAVVDFSWQRTMQTLFWFEYLTEISPEQRTDDLQPTSALMKVVPRVGENAEEQMVRFLVLPHST